MSLQSRSLSGQPFIQEHHIFLSIAARAHQWSGNVWVPAKVAARLQLPLKPDTTPPLRLEGSNGHSLVYHTDQFTEPLETLQKAWNDFAAKRDSFPAGTPSSDTAASADASAPAFPLSTNGERFDRDTEERILRCIKKHEGSFKSPYWSTAAEAESIFHSPFRDAYLADTSRAVVASDFVLCRPVTLYNVDGTSDPSRFTSTTCRRYDPVNYKGRFYRPSAAVRMKAFAVRHNCLHERQWITVRRALLLGFSIPHSVSPISFFFSSPVDLINVAVLRRSTLIRGHIVSSAVSPHNANERYAALTAADLFALNQRSRFVSYTQFDDVPALQRSFQCAPLAVRLAYEERAAAINDELERVNMMEESVLPLADEETDA